MKEKYFPYCRATIDNPGADDWVRTENRVFTTKETIAIMNKLTEENKRLKETRKELSQTIIIILKEINDLHITNQAQSLYRL